MLPRYSIGFDFGTESVRVARRGHRATAASPGRRRSAYAHGVIDDALPTSGETAPAGLRAPAPAGLARRRSRPRARPRCAQAASTPDEVVGIGVDFTSCTMLPCRRRRHAAVPDSSAFKTRPARLAEAVEAPRRQGRDRPHQRGRARAQRAVARALRRDDRPRVVLPQGPRDAQPRARRLRRRRGLARSRRLVRLAAHDGPFPHCSPTQLVRSTCQAGYKAMWNAQDGLPVARVLRRGAPEARGRRRGEDARRPS